MFKEAALIREGKVGVMPTDTLYGIVASAFDHEAIERVYRVKDRMPVKPPIILISSIDDLTLFGVTATEPEMKVLSEVWPGPVSVVLSCDDEAFEYLHRGARSLAFRLPDKRDLRDFLADSGPLIAPSANLEGHPPATTIEEAKKYFGDRVDFYIDGGVIEGTASIIIRVGVDGSVETLRK